MNRKVLLLTVFFIGVFTTVACSDATQSTDSPTQRQQGLTNTTFVDHNGWEWEKVGEVDSYVDESSPTNIGSDDGQERPSISDMTVEEIANKFRPIMEFNQNVYRLSDADATNMAQQMKTAQQNGVTRTDPEKSISSSFSKSISPSSGTSIGTTASGTTSASDKDGGHVFGGDERTPAPSDTWPDRMIAQQGAGCTGFKLMNHHTAVTAAHCVFDAGEGVLDGIDGWRDPSGWRFSADDNLSQLDRTDENCIARIVPAFYRNAGHHVKFDIAIILFQNPFGSCEQSKYDVGYFGYDGVTPSDDKATHQIAGYPRPTPFGTTYPDYYADQDDAWVRPLFPNRLVYTIDATDGNSGGPVAKEQPSWNGHESVYVTGVHSGWVRFPFVTRNQGRRFTGGVINWMRFMSNIALM